jgi:hypothetical protein
MKYRRYKKKTYKKKYVKKRYFKRRQRGGKWDGMIKIKIIRDVPIIMH